MSDVIDYLYDYEVEAYGVIVRCEDCDEPGDAVDMRRQSDGGWLCAPCESGYEAEWQDHMRRLRGF